MNTANIIVITVVLVVLSTPYLRTNVFFTDSPSAYFTIVNTKGEHFQGAFMSIQQVINEAENGSTIIVPSGVYNEHVIVNKTVSLVGEDVLTTIIDGTYNGTVVQITADNVSISGLTLRNSGCKWDYSGVSTYRSENCEIKNCYFSNSCHNIKISYSSNCRVFGNTINGKCYGIRLMNSVNCAVFDNYVSNCYGGIILSNATNCVVKENYVINHSYGIRFDSPCADNKVFDNVVSNNGYDGIIAIMPGNSSFVGNIIFHNNFIDNTKPFVIQTAHGFTWDSNYPSGGNYWSRYNGTDMYRGPNQNVNGSDGIGDKAYIIKNASHQDRYPLVYPWSPLAVHNINTGLGYLTIQEAINANESLSGHTIYVEAGIYNENVIINKTLSFLGEDPATTIIDGENIGTVLTVKADNVNISRFTLRNSGQSYLPFRNDCGLFLDHCSKVNISNNLIMNNHIGIYLFFSRESNIENNLISHNQEDGLWLWYSGGNFLRENEISNNSYNFGVSGGCFSDFNNTIDMTNKVNGKPILYQIGIEDEVFDDHMEIGALYLINCNNVTVRNLNLTKNGHGIFCYNIINSRIENVNISENNYGIYLQKSHDNLIVDNQCLDNWVGICLHDSSHNIIENNLVDSNEKGISLYDATNNSLTGNTIRNNLYGIRFYNSHFNKIFHNNLIENTEQVSLISSSYQNVWDNGFEGNFWSNYNASDNILDGLGDTDQIIDDNNRDRYPLMGVFQTFSIFYKDKFSDVGVISNSTILKFVFEDANNTIRLTVNGTDGTYGFCRISIPHALIMPELMVIIDDNATTVLYANYNLRDDGSCRWIYFAYQHSVHEIIIIQEFLSLIYLSILIDVTLPCLLFFKKQR